jgi:hypothetical protein
MPRQIAFLDRYIEVGNVFEASTNICHRCSHYEWLRTSDVYRRAFEDARAVFADFLLSEATRLALVGEEIPVIRGGKLLMNDDGTPVTRYRRNISLLKVLIKMNETRPQSGAFEAVGKEKFQNPTLSDTKNSIVSNSHTQSKTNSLGTAVAQPVPITERPAADAFLPRRLRRAHERKAGKMAVA